MPWEVGPHGEKGWPIVKSDTGEVVGYSKTPAKASAAVRARYASLAGADESGSDTWRRKLAASDWAKP